MFIFHVASCTWSKLKNFLYNLFLITKNTFQSLKLQYPVHFILINYRSQTDCQKELKPFVFRAFEFFNRFQDGTCISYIRGQL